MFGLLARISIRGKIIAALQRLDAVETAAAAVRGTWLPSSRALGRVAQLAERVRSYEGLYFLAEDDQDRKGRVAKTALAVQEMSTAVKEYEALVIPGEAQRLAAAMTHSRSV